MDPSIVEPERIKPFKEMFESKIWKLDGEMKTNLGKEDPSSIEVIHFVHEQKGYTMVSPIFKGAYVESYVYPGYHSAPMCLAWFLDNY